MFDASGTTFFAKNSRVLDTYRTFIQSHCLTEREFMPQPFILQLKRTCRVVPLFFEIRQDQTPFQLWSQLDMYWESEQGAPKFPPRLLEQMDSAAYRIWDKDSPHEELNSMIDVLWYSEIQELIVDKAKPNSLRLPSAVWAQVQRQTKPSNPRYLYMCRLIQDLKFVFGLDECRPIEHGSCILPAPLPELDEAPASPSGTSKVPTDSFTCGQCGKRLSTSKSLHRHKRVHSGTEYRCHVLGCRRTFTRKDNIRKHMRIKHGQTN